MIDPRAESDAMPMIHQLRASNDCFFGFSTSTSNTGQAMRRSERTSRSRISRMATGDWRVGSRNGPAGSFFFIRSGFPDDVGFEALRFLRADPGDRQVAALAAGGE